MRIIANPSEMQAVARDFARQNEDVGFVPTMGALHAGHLELCRRARKENARFVASIFVNPTQFGPGEDLNLYPRPLENDLQMLENAGCDAVFTPEARAMYGESDGQRAAYVEVPHFDEVWEGVSRPGHLRGVATVVAELFNICGPTRAYFGEKDFQQLCVVQALVRDPNFPLEVVPVATIRESDGLALSSRNRYLSEADRAIAATIPRALQAGKNAARSGETDVARLNLLMSEILRSEPEVRVQYLAIVDAQTLQPLTKTNDQARIIIAAHVGKTRLIDNVAI